MFYYFVIIIYFINPSIMKIIDQVVAVFAFAIIYTYFIIIVRGHPYNTLSYAVQTSPTGMVL